MGWLRAKLHLHDYGMFLKDLQSELEAEVPPDVDRNVWNHSHDGLVHCGAYLAVCTADDEITRNPMRATLVLMKYRNWNLDIKDQSFIQGFADMSSRIRDKAYELGVFY
jgi:hypothetical protein